MNNDHISISEMASLHGLTRRTLIYYDKIDLFHPTYTADNGYRYYSISQIPYLREICFLKNIGLTLEEIKEMHTGQNTPELSIRHLEQCDKHLIKEISILNQKRAYINDRKQFLSHMNTKQKNIGLPYIQWYPERKAIFMPFEESEMQKGKLHFTLMKAWRKLSTFNLFPSSGFGSILRTAYINSDTPLKNAGSIIYLPFSNTIEDPCIITIPEGDYVTLYKYGMPYEVSESIKLLNWIETQNFVINGDIYDMCLLDTIFYDTIHQTDFGMLQIPIK